MINYLLYWDNGEIAQTGYCPEDHLPQVDGTALMVVDTLYGVSSLTHHVADGQLVEYTPEEAEAKTRPPHRAAQWSNASMSYLDDRPIETLREEKWEQVKQWRAQAIVAPTMDTPYGVFDAYIEAMSNVTNALLGRQAAESLGLAPDPIQWTLADNTVVALTTAQLAEVAVLLLSRGDAAHQRARSLRQQIDEATTPAELDAVQWEAPNP
jgi:hypothetical protein